MLLINIFILQIFQISNNYTFELIEGLVPKYISFETIDFNAFKIFKYIPSCTDNSSQNKIIYTQFVIFHYDIDLYLYENFNDIEQNDLAIFINYKDYRYIKNGNKYMFDSFSDLTCGKEYYFIISMATEKTYSYPIYLEFNIIDESIDKINISPLKSNSFIIQNRKPQEILSYYHNETKYAIIFLNNNKEVKILKNNEVIYYEKNYVSQVEPIEFEKNNNYTIYLEGNQNSLISIQFFDKPKFYNLDTNNIIPLYYKKYYFEFDISNYQLNDIILFRLDSSGSFSFAYQYKQDFKGNNFKDLGYFLDTNYIPIKKTIEDKTLIIFIEFHTISLSLLSIIKDVEEIKAEFKKEILGPKYYYIDNFEFNNMNSIGIGASEFFLLSEQEKSKTSESKFTWNNYYITKKNNYSPDVFNNIIIKFNSKNKITFEIKKFNYSIFINDPLLSQNEEFFQLCQGENTLNELYFYVQIKDLKLIEELFLPVFGSFDSYYIIEEDIYNLTDFDFDKIKTPNFYNTYQKIGYLKITCKEPLMLKHFILHFDNGNNKELISGQKYYIRDYYLKNNNSYTFSSNLVENDLNIKITVYGLEPDQSINLVFNNKIYLFTFDNYSQELHYKYEKYLSEVFYFELNETIENSLIGEIIVGILPKDINNMFRQMDFDDLYGSLILSGNEGVVIKFPNDFSEDLYNYSLIFPIYDSYINNYLYIDISYDKLEFQTKYSKDLYENISPVIPLFQVNPYKYIQKNLLDNSEDKFFYIFIFNEDYEEKNIYIKKPIIYSDSKFNKINVLPQLSEVDAIYYYQLKIPEPQNNSYVLVQHKRGEFPQAMSISKNNIQYPILNDGDGNLYYNIPYDKRDKKSVVYLNFYDVEEKPGYINFIETNEHIYSDYFKFLELNLTASQLKGKNKLRIKLNSLSYIFYPNIVKYYFIANMDDNIDVLFSMLTGQTIPDKDKHQFMIEIEDDGKNEIFEKDIKIDIELDENTKNVIFCIPMIKKTNLIERTYIESTLFEYKNLTFFEKHKFLIVFLIIGIVLFILILAIIILYLKCRNTSIRELEDKVLNEKLNSVS